MNLKRIISELKRRNVPKAALAYLVVAWMIVQVCSILLPTFEAPQYVMQTIVVCLISGFPLWVLFSWIYDISSAGITKTIARIDSKPGMSDGKIGSRLNKIIIISLTAAVILLLYNQFSGQTIARSRRGLAQKGINGTVAVLPFINNKPNPNNDYLGFAIANQVIGGLNYLQNISVRSASSVRKYDKQTVNLPKIKEELNVDYALVGNFLKEDNRIRVIVELIELDLYSMVWRSDNIEVDFSNTFALQDIVAKKVVDGLNIKFSNKELDLIIRDVPQDPLAYEYYLRSTSYPLNSEGDQLAVEMLHKSIDLDSTYAPAYADLGFRTQRLTFFKMLDEEKMTEAENYYLKSLSLNPDLLSALGYLAVFYTENNRIEDAIKLTRRMIELNHNNASALFSLGYLYRYIGMLNESIHEMEKAVEIDPKNTNYSRIGVSYLCVGEFEKALKAFKKGRNTAYSLTWQGHTLHRMGKMDEALPYFEEVIANDGAPYVVHFCIALKSAILGKYQDGINAARFVEKANSRDSEGWYYLAATYALLNEEEGAMRCLRESVNRGYYNYTFMIADPVLDPLRSLPGYEKIINKAKEKHLYFKDKFFDRSPL